MKEAVDRLDDDAPLGEAGQRTQGVEARLELDGNADTQLWVILDLLPIPGPCRRSPGATMIFHAVFGHGGIALARHG